MGLQQFGQMIEQVDAKVAIVEESKCIACNRAGGVRRWELCSNGHFEFVCDPCIMQHDRRRGCIAKDCNSQPTSRLVKDLVALRQRWFECYEANKLIIKKYTLIKEDLLSLHEDTWDPFRISVERALRSNSQLSKSRYFDEYIQTLTNYILSCKLQASRQEFSKLLEQDDRLNTEIPNMIKAYEDINTYIMTTQRKLRPKQGIKIDKHSIHCLVCFNNFNVLYTWTYCENQHPHNSICKDCLYKMKECPVCRGKIRSDRIKATEDSMEEWDSILNRHLAISDLLNLLNKETISKASKQTIYKKLRDQRHRVKNSDLSEYPVLIQNLASEWCYELNLDKCNLLFKMMVAYEQEYELLINLNKVIKDKLEGFGDVKKVESKTEERRQVSRVISDSQESSWSSLDYNGYRRGTQNNNRRYFGWPPNRERSRSYSRSRSRDDSERSLESESQSSVSLPRRPINTRARVDRRYT